MVNDLNPAAAAAAKRNAQRLGLCIRFDGPNAEGGPGRWALTKGRVLVLLLSSIRNRLSLDVLQMDASLLLRSLLRGDLGPPEGLSPALLEAATVTAAYACIYVYVISYIFVYV